MKRLSYPLCRLTDLMMGWVQEFGGAILIWRDYKVVVSDLSIVGRHCVIFLFFYYQIKILCNFGRVIFKSSDHLLFQFFITDPVILDQLWSNITDFKKLAKLPNRTLYNEMVTGTRSFLTTSGGSIYYIGQPHFKARPHSTESSGAIKNCFSNT